MQQEFAAYLKCGRLEHSFYFERNRPSTFTHPYYSVIGDVRMYGEMWLGKIPI